MPDSGLGAGPVWNNLNILWQKVRQCSESDRGMSKRPRGKLECVLTAQIWNNLSTKINEGPMVNVNVGFWTNLLTNSPPQKSCFLVVPFSSAWSALFSTLTTEFKTEFLPICWWETIYQYGFNLHFSNYEWVGTPFHMFKCHFCIVFVNSQFQSVSQFSLEFVVFVFLIFKCPYLYSRDISLSYMVQIFASDLSFVFAYFFFNSE